ncbi:MAG: hypothetical protein DCF17_09790 [Shackletoniella antarctica]|jgi:hypothetical protein|uniref:RiboL-PSP-HEPN domain-containing protein n=1 Tax=Shackletoniella antarctica TaxID=268115 RepID=A0A2W4WAU6_9CYAN|nr:MAG: hypothetical protein DCF17_09790 [Shackletoniella antarctica]
MINHEVNRQIQSLKFLLKKTSQISGDDSEVQSHWAKYICILSAGLLENSIYEIYREFVENASSKPVSNFATATLYKIQNPNATRFIEISRSFNPLWADELEKYLSEDGRKEAIDSIIANRHKIAHGKPSNISLSRIREYLEKSIQVLSFLEEQVKR